MKIGYTAPLLIRENDLNDAQALRNLLINEIYITKSINWTPGAVHTPV